MPNFPGVRKRVSFTTKDMTFKPPRLADPTQIRVEFGLKHEVPVEFMWPAPGSQIIQDDLGSFHIDLDCDRHGEWACRIESDGLVGVQEVSWYVDESNFE